VRIPCIEVNESVRDGWRKQYSNKNKNGIITFQRKISQIQCQQIDIVDDAGLQQRKSFEFFFYKFDLMSKEVGGKTNLKFNRLDQKNYIRKKRARRTEYGTLVIYCNTSKKVGGKSKFLSCISNG
jgi:hypothetical protein